MEKEIILNKIKDIAVEYNIHILSGQLNKYRLDDLFVLEVGEVVNEEIKKDFQTTFYDKHKIKVSLNNISKPLKDKINVLFMTKNEIKKTIFYSYVIKHYDYTRYLTKQFKRTLNKEKKHTDHRFMDYKRIEMTLSNTALKYYVEESVMKLDFHFKIREIYLDELFLNEYILPIIEGVFLDSASMSHELKSIIYGSEINFDAINRVIKFDPITISKFTNSTMINKNIRTKRNEVIPCSEVKNYLNGNVILTHYSSNYATRYNVQLENHLLKKGIYSREFYKISAHRDFKSITDQNMDMFLSNSFHFENFIEKTNLLPLKNKLKLLSLMSDMMKYIETEYKKIIRPIIFPVEDLLIDLTYNAIIELLVQNKVSLGDNYKLNSEARINPKNGNKRGIKDIPFYEYNSIVVSLIQKKNSSSLASLLPAYNDFKGE